MSKPLKPTMGDLTQVSDTGWDAWTGGRPKPSWSGLDDTDGLDSPNQLRPIYASSAQKGYNYRKKGLEVKFDRKDDLQVFQKKVKAHLVDCGMDSISWLEDPIDPSRMVNIIYDHPRFTQESAISSLRVQLLLYDKYDRENDTAARKFLIGSLVEELADQLEERLDDKDAFPLVWMQFLKLIQSTSVERFEDLKLRIKSRLPAQYPGENLEDLGRDFRRDATELITAGQYDHNLTLTMLKIFLQAGGRGNEDFRFALRMRKQSLDQALIDIGHMSKKDSLTHMVKNNLTVKDICLFVENEYRRQKDRNEWPPARHAKDSKAAPPQFGAHLTEAHVLALIQHHGPSNKTVSFDKSNVKCFNCNSTGHFKRDCPKLKNQNRGPGGPSGRPRTNKHQKSSLNSWKTTPPLDTDRPSSQINGKPVFSKDHNGRKFTWCSVCGDNGRWSTTHSTGQHGHQGGSAPSAHMASYANVTDPSAWHVHVPSSDLLLADLWEIAGPHLLAFLSGTIFAAFMAIGWAFLAPLLWIVGFGTFFWFLPSFISSRPAHPRHFRRRFHHRPKHRRRQRRSQPGSIRDHGFNKSYPRHLRSRGHYFQRAPTIEERVLHGQISRLHSLVLRIQSEVTRLRHSRADCCSSCSSTVREGDRWHDVRPVCTTGKRQGRRFRRKDKANAKYRPVPASSHHGHGNLNCTHAQVSAVEKIVVHCHMAKLTTHPASPAVASPAVLRMALQHPSAFRAALPKEETFSVIWDSGASACITFDKEDFVGPFKPPSTITYLKGISSGLRIHGQGHVMWTITDSHGQLRILKVPAYYVPKSQVRLLSTAALLQKYPDETIQVRHNELTLSGSVEDPTRGAITAYINPSNNLPISTAYRYNGISAAPMALSTTITNVHESNLNLTEPEKELMRWHERLGHASFAKVQFLMRSGVLAFTRRQKQLHATACRLTTPLPKCAACQFGKQCNRPTPGKTPQGNVQNRAGIIRADNLLPGQQVSIDHFVCSTKGRLFSSKGKSKDGDMYSGGCIFVDHSSNFIHVEFQTHLNSHETLRAKTDFEAVCRDSGVIPQSYLSDNGSAFTSKAFSSHLEVFRQIIRFAGVGSHHHNGHAERAIQTVMSIARTMMLHSAIHWPDMADPCLWPMAVQHAVFLYNHTPSAETGLSPQDLFSKTKWDLRRLLDLHVWGCPVYVLDKTIADGKKIPRWKPRSLRTMNVGISIKHHSSVALVLNPASGSITPQWNVVYDDWFATVTSNVDTLPDFNSPEWCKLFGDSTFSFPDDPTDNSDLSSPPNSLALQHRHDVAQAFSQLPTEPLAPPPAVLAPIDSLANTFPPLPSDDPPKTPKFSTFPTRKPRSHDEMREPSPLSREPSYPEAPFYSPTPSYSPRELDFPTPPAPRPSPVSVPSPPLDQREKPVASPESVAPGGLERTNFEPPPRRSSRIRQAPTRLKYNRLGYNESGFMAKFDNDTVPLITTLALIARKRGIKDPNVESWAHAVNKKLSDIGIESMVEIQATLADLNQKLKDNGHTRFHQSTIDALRKHQVSLAPAPSNDPVDAPSTYPRASLFEAGNMANNNFVRIVENSGQHPSALLVEMGEPEAFGLAAAKDPDTLSWGEAMADPDKEKWLEAARVEIEALESNRTWQEVPKSAAETKIIPGTWVFRRKRTPDGEIKKYKGRFCVRGDLIEGDFNTHAPVVAWPTVRVLLVLSMLMGWKTCSIDFDSAFVQASLNDPVWIHVPRGFKSPNCENACLELKKSLYGLTIAPKLWYEHLTKAFLKLGFQQSEHDKCLFFKHKIMVVAYVDDCGIGSESEEQIVELIDGLRAQGFNLTREGNFEEFLGIKIDRTEWDAHGRIHMTQQGLIQKTISYVGMQDCNPNWTPASSVALGANPDDEPHETESEWNYATAVGMLQYLAINTRPDIAFAVSQVSRFTHHPKKSHSTAVKTIARYLKRTEDKGTYFEQDPYLNDPDECFRLDCFVDADFAGLYKQEPDRSPAGAKSRTGYIIRLAGNPLIWKSKLQTEISLSTLESEYSALSQAMRQLLPLRKLILELMLVLQTGDTLKSMIKCTVFEDNNGALALATNQRITSRTKYFHVKWHHFWHHVTNGDVQVEKIDTKEQLADYLTKGLTRETFEYLRKQVQGW
jgi:hypothetical protein